MGYFFNDPADFALGTSSLAVEAAESKFEICTDSREPEGLNACQGFSASWCTSEVDQSPTQVLLEERIFRGISRSKKALKQKQEIQTA